MVAIVRIYTILRTQCSHWYSCYSGIQPSFEESTGIMCFSSIGNRHCSCSGYAQLPSKYPHQSLELWHQCQLQELVDLKLQLFPVSGTRSCTSTGWRRKDPQTLCEGSWIGEMTLALKQNKLTWATVCAAFWIELNSTSLGTNMKWTATPKFWQLLCSRPGPGATRPTLGLGRAWILWVSNPSKL